MESGPFPSQASLDSRQLLNLERGTSYIRCSCCTVRLLSRQNFRKFQLLRLVRKRVSPKCTSETQFVYGHWWQFRLFSGQSALHSVKAIANRIVRFLFFDCHKLFTTDKSFVGEKFSVWVLIWWAFFLVSKIAAVWPVVVDLFFYEASLICVTWWH